MVLSALTDSSQIPNSVEQLASCVFVQNVEAPALSVTTPILIKGLNDRKVETKRKCCVIIDNMCKLVEHPKEILVFSEKLRYLLVNCAENISDPEARNVAEKALATVDLFYKQTQTMDFTNKSQEYIESILNEAIDSPPPPNYYGRLLPLVTNLCNHQEFSEEIWKDIFDEYMPHRLVDETHIICETVLQRLRTTFDVKEDVFEDTEEGQDLYKGGFLSPMVL